MTPPPVLITAELGAEIELDATALDRAGLTAEASSVLVRALPPDGSDEQQIDATLTNGAWIAELVLDVAGDWHVRVEVTGEEPAVAECILRARSSRFTV